VLQVLQLGAHASQLPVPALSVKPIGQAVHVAVSATAHEPQLLPVHKVHVVVVDGFGAKRASQLSHWSVVVVPTVTWEHSKQFEAQGAQVVADESLNLWLQSLQVDVPEHMSQFVTHTSQEFAPVLRAHAELQAVHWDIDGVAVTGTPLQVLQAAGQVRQTEASVVLTTKLVLHVSQMMLLVVTPAALVVGLSRHEAQLDGHMTQVPSLAWRA